MKRLLSTMLLALGAMALWSGAAQASGAFGLIPGCGCCYCNRGVVCFRQYNAFTPVCCGAGPGEGHGNFLPGCSPPYVAGSAWGLDCGPCSGYEGQPECLKHRLFHFFHCDKCGKHGNLGPSCPECTAIDACSSDGCGGCVGVNQCAAGTNSGPGTTPAMMAANPLPWNQAHPMGYAAYPVYGAGTGYGAAGYPQQGYGWPVPQFQPVGYTPMPGAQGWTMPAYWYNTGSR
jgi:hypothetical protein